MVNLAVVKETQAGDAPFTTRNGHCCQKPMSETMSSATETAVSWQVIVVCHYGEYTGEIGA
ncbi:hypothetical protein TIFTF001_018017 [Ficus carica]|uniref:Uncharacterized protein n=1 Tax=Ficus carica TaxID=3494 RepID=A0AA88AAC2_FICCA|nr:hypothetical protein TIFTF001_018017 [Ficus carica]